jgi:hypothetical protein
MPVNAILQCDKDAFPKGRKIMCDCFEKGSEKIKELLVEQLKKDDSGFIKVVSAGYKNRCFCLSGNSSAPINLPFEIKYKRELKNRKIKEKTVETGILPSYCPFCGEKFNKEESEPGKADRKD